MRVHAHTHCPPRWLVWHCEWCRQVPAVWADDVTNEWGEWDLSAEGRRHAAQTGELAGLVFKAKRIVISFEHHSVYINPLPMSLDLEAKNRILDLVLP